MAIIRMCGLALWIAGAMVATTPTWAGPISRSSMSVSRAAPGPRNDVRLRTSFGQRHAAAIARNSSALRLAPPTSAPSTSATLKSSLAFAGLTEPP